MMATPVLTSEQVGFTYNPGRRNAYNVFEGLDLVIEAGEVVGIVGPSGSGKTTFLSIAAMLESPTKGRILFCGDETPEWETSRLRRENTGLITQTGDLDPSLTAFENVWLIPKGMLSKKVRRVDAEELLDAVGLKREAWKSRPKDLSAGERQRVAIARALACKPKIIFADEPTANLDGASKSDVIETILAVKPPECAVVIVSHDEDVVRSHCHRVILMKDGEFCDGLSGTSGQPADSTSFESESDEGAVTRAEKKEVGTWLFYLVWLVMLIIEGAIVKFLGLWLSGVLFTIGGPLLGLLSYRTTDPTDDPRDPFIKAARWLVVQSKAIGFIVGSLVAGPMGMGVTYRKMQFRNGVLLTVLSGIWFALFWVPAFYFFLG